MGELDKVLSGGLGRFNAVVRGKNAPAVIRPKSAVRKSG